MPQIEEIIIRESILYSHPTSHSDRREFTPKEYVRGLGLSLSIALDLGRECLRWRTEYSTHMLGTKGVLTLAGEQGGSHQK